MARRELPNALSLRDDRGGFGSSSSKKTLDRLTALCGPGESYSDVILRLATAD
jgi:hypothetical protein